MRLNHIVLLIALSAYGQSVVRKSVCASGCDYVNTYLGLNSALSDAASYQGGSCVPYLIEIDTANPVDLLGNTIFLPAKTCAQYVRIRSMQIGSLPSDGTRLDPSTQSGYLARIQSTTITPNSPMFVGPTGAYTRYWAFEGIDFYGNGVDPSAVNHYYGLLVYGSGAGTYPSSADRSLRPDHLEVKHCWMHGVPGTRNVLYALGLYGNSISVRDNVIEDIAGDRSDAQAVGMFHFDGPVELINNTLDAATENTLVGGGFESAGTLPSFIRFIGNKYSKKGYYKFQSGTATPNFACRPGNVYRNTSTNHDWTCSGAAPGTWTDTGGLTTNGTDSVKNLWEIKMGRGLRVFGNDFSGIWWPSAQNGEIFVMNLTTQDTVSNPAWVQPNNIKAQPWTTITDVYIGANLSHDAISFMNLAYPGNGGFVCALKPETKPWCYANAHNDIRVYDNLSYNMSDERDYDKGTPVQSSFLMTINAGDFDIDFRHNTYLLSNTTAASGEMYLMLAQDINGLQTGTINFRDNITPLGEHSVAAPGVGYGGLCSFLPGLSASATYDFGGNTLTTDKVNWNGSSYPIVTGAIPTPCSTYFLYPPGTKSAASGGTAVDGAYHARAAYQNTATDGRDPGVNVEHVNWATAGAATGALNTALEYKLRSAVTSSSGTQRGVSVYFTTPSVNACTWELSSDANAYSASVPVTSQNRNGRDGTAVWSGLSPGKAYFVRATCDGLKLEQAIDGRRFKFITAP